MVSKMEEGWLEVLLKKQWSEKGVAKVLQAESKPAVAAGENYAGRLDRITMRVVLGSGLIATRSLIVKTPSEDAQLQADFLEKLSVFKTETQVYTMILPEIERLMEKHGDPSERLWCNLISHDEDKQIILEDLKALGFRNEDRKKRLNIEHITMTVGSLARLHAMSTLLMREGRLQGVNLPPYSMARNEDIINLFTSSGISILADVIRTDWGKHWEEAADRVEKYGDVINDKLHKLWQDKDSRFMVFNHGDCWINNIMYKYDIGSNKPNTLRFVDFQESHFNTCGWDLVYLFYTSLSPEQREEHTEVLLKEYWRVFKAVYEFYGVNCEGIPGVSEIAQEMERLAPMAVMVTTSILPVLMCEEVLETQRILNLEDEEGQLCRRNMYRSREYTGFVRRDLESWLLKGII